VYTWLVELTFGLAGVLSTVTMASPYDPRIAAQLIRLRKFRWNRLFLSRVNLELSSFIQLKYFNHFQDSCGGGLPLPRADSWLFKYERVPLKFLFR
jgi:hypothetical protein